MGASDADGSGACPVGFECPGATKDRFESACPLGRINANIAKPEKFVTKRLCRVCPFTAPILDCPAKYFCPGFACKIVPTEGTRVMDYGPEPVPMIQTVISALESFVKIQFVQSPTVLKIITNVLRATNVQKVTANRSHVKLDSFPIDRCFNNVSTVPPDITAPVKPPIKVKRLDSRIQRLRRH